MHRRGNVSSLDITSVLLIVDSGNPDSTRSHCVTNATGEDGFCSEVMSAKVKLLSLDQSDTKIGQLLGKISRLQFLKVVKTC